MVRRGRRKGGLLREISAAIIDRQGACDRPLTLFKVDSFPLVVSLGTETKIDLYDGRLKMMDA